MPFRIVFRDGFPLRLPAHEIIFPIRFTIPSGRRIICVNTTTHRRPDIKTESNIYPDSIDMLIDRIKDGDRKAFDALMHAHQHYVYAVSFRILGQDADAKDVTQECFIQVWQHIDRYDASRSKFTTWIYRIVYHLCIDRLRAQKRRRASSSSEENLQSLPGLGDVEAHVSDADLARVILLLAEKLTPMQRIVFTLRDVEECSVSEVSHITGMSRASVKVHSSMARKRLRKLLHGLEKENIPR